MSYSIPPQGAQPPMPPSDGAPGAAASSGAAPGAAAPSGAATGRIRTAPLASAGISVACPPTGRARHVPTRCRAWKTSGSPHPTWSGARHSRTTRRRLCLATFGFILMFGAVAAKLTVVTVLNPRLPHQEATAMPRGDGQRDAKADQAGRQTGRQAGRQTSARLPPPRSLLAFAPGSWTVTINRWAISVHARYPCSPILGRSSIPSKRRIG